MKSCIRGFHVYADEWQPVEGEKLVCKPQTNNSKDYYAVAVCKPITASALGQAAASSEAEYETRVVGHVPRLISRVCWLFLQKEGSLVHCIVTNGGRRYSADLPQGGLEIPCTLTFTGKEEELLKVHSLLNNYSENNYSVCCNVTLVHSFEE